MALSDCLAWTRMWQTRKTCVLLGLGVMAGLAEVRPQIPAPCEPKVVAVAAIPGALRLDKWRTTGPVLFTVSDMDAPGAGRKALRAEMPPP